MAGEQVLIAGVGMTPFARSPGRGVRDMAVTASREALSDAGVDAADVERIFFGIAAAGAVTRQEMIPGQVAFRDSELAGKPLINVENACASSSSAFQLAFDAIAAGHCDVALVTGAEQLNHAERERTFIALRGSTDIEEIGETGPGGDSAHSVLMDFYAQEAREFLEETGADVADLARVAVKNRANASHNPLAQYRKPQTVEEVLAARSIVQPLTLPMCAPTTDGAAALALCSADYAKKLNGGLVEVSACELRSGSGHGSHPVADAASAAYEAAGVGPDDLDVLELHDAAAPAELSQYSEVGICERGEAHHLLRRGGTELGGAIPVNTSGGLLSRGHPLGATGAAQLVELCTQLRGRAGDRQVQDAQIAMAVNGGGWLAGTYAVAVATVVRRAG